jgi:cytochrome b561
MPTPTASTRYSLPAIALHWLLAVGLIGLLAFGWYMTGLPFSPARLKYYNWHKWAGVTILVLSLLRLVWRLTHRPPALPAAMAAPCRAGSTWPTMACTTCCTCCSLPCRCWAGLQLGRRLSHRVVRSVAAAHLVPADPALAEALKPWHMISAYTLAALIALHIAAALKHQFIDRDGLLRRMLPGKAA